MAAYLAQRIIDGALDYTYVVTRRADLKILIDAVLIEKGRSNLITVE